MTRIHSRKKSRRRVSRRRVSRRRVSRRRVSRRRVSRRRVSRRRVSRRRVSRRRVSRKKYALPRLSRKQRMSYRMELSQIAGGSAAETEEEIEAIRLLNQIKSTQQNMDTFHGNPEQWDIDVIKKYKEDLKTLRKENGWDGIFPSREWRKIKKAADKKYIEDEFKSLTTNTNRCEHGISGCTGGECDECTARIRWQYST